MTSSSQSMAQKQRALWVGGPPGKTFVKIRGRLERAGLVVEEQIERWNGGKIPAWCTLVLANTDMLDHGSYGAVKAMAKARGIAFGVVSLHWTKTLQNLRELGVITEPVVDLAIEEEKDEMPNTPTPIRPVFTNHKPTPEELVAYMRSSTDPAVKAAIVEEGRRIQREGYVLEAVAALGALDDDGLTDLVAALSPRVLDALKVLVKP